MSPLLFSAFPCDPGTENEAPIFVTGLKSLDTRLRTEFTCNFEQACEIPLFSRDMAFGIGNIVSPETKDEISIEAAIGFDTLDQNTLYKPDGSECRGVGALHCIYKLIHSDMHQFGSSDQSKKVHIRCFTTFDIHDGKAAPQQRTCRSAPFCIKIHFTRIPSWHGLYPPLGLLKAYLETTDHKRFRGAKVLLRWSDLADLDADVSSALQSHDVVVQYSLARSHDVQERFFDIEKSFLHVMPSKNISSQRYIMVDDLMDGSSCARAQCEFTFRLQFRPSHHAPPGNNQRIYGPASNSILLARAAPRADTRLVVAGWQSNLLRIWDVAAARRGESAFATIQSNPVAPGSMTIDSTGNRVFAIVEPVGDSLISTPVLARIDLTNGAILQIIVGFDVSMRNIAYDEASDVILAIQSAGEISNSRSSLISIDPDNGHTSHIATLEEAPRSSLSAYSRTERVYYYIIQRTRHIQRISLEGGQGIRDGQKVAPQLRTHLEPMLVSEGNNYVIALSCCTDGLLYTLEGPWPQRTGDAILLSIYDPEKGMMVKRTTTSISGLDITYAIVEFHVDKSSIVMISSRGRYSTYNMDSNVTTREEARDIGLRGTIVNIMRHQDRTPMIAGTTTPSALTDSSNQITVTGFNFGMRDFSPVVNLEPPMWCKVSQWLSDYAVACLLSDRPDFMKESLRNGVVDMQITVRTGSRISSKVRATTFIESWDPHTSTTNSSVLTFPRFFTMFGEGFHVPFASYRSVFSNQVYLAVSGPPTSFSRNHLTFELPAWPSSAALATTSLRRMSSDNLTAWPDTIIHHFGNPVSFRFTEAWERISSVSAPTEGALLVTITGSGFDTGTNASYFCVFQHNSQEYSSNSLAISQSQLSIKAQVLSHRQVLCNIMGWTEAAASVSFWLIHGKTPVRRTLQGDFAHPSSVSFVFQQGWTSLQPSQGSINAATLTYITGFGFNRTGVYVCVFSKISGTSPNISIPTNAMPGHAMLDQHVAAIPLNTTTLECSIERSVGEVSFPMALVTVLQVTEGGALSPVAKSGVPEYFAFLPAWIRSSPASVFAAGGEIVTIFGLGFPSDVLYECIFSAIEDMERAGETQEVLAVNGSWTSSDTIQCVAPEWPYPAGLAKVLVRNREYGPPSVMQPVTFDILFSEIVISSQHPASAYASVADIVLSFGGKGFASALDYICMLSANQSDPSDLGNHLGKTRLLNTTVTGRAANTSQIICDAPMDWPYYSGRIEVSLLRAGLLVPSSSIISHLTIMERWTNVEPRTVSAVGARITISGHGFAGQASDYYCYLFQENSLGSLNISIVAMSVNLSHIECHLPEGMGGMQAGAVLLSLSKEGQRLSPPTLSASDFLISEVVTSLSPSYGSAFGGELVSIFGYGFIVPARIPDFTENFIGNRSVLNKCNGTCNDTCHRTCVRTSGDSAFNVSRCQYLCTRSAAQEMPYSSLFGGVVKARCVAQTVTLIVCISPEWGFAASDTIGVSLLREENSVATVPTEVHWDEGTNLFQFFHEVAANGVSPTVADSLAGALLQIKGRGFDTHTDYACFWTTQHFSLTHREPALVFNSTLLTCVAKYWPFYAGISNFTVLNSHNGSLRTVGARAPLYFQHLAAVNSSVPTRTGGGVTHEVTIVGAGFDPWRPLASYQCAVELGEASAVAMAVEYWKIVCKLPAWTRGAARTSIQLLDTSSNISVPDRVPFEYGQQILRIEPSECLAISGSNITIIGGGFSPYSNYSVLLHRITAHDGGELTEQMYCPLVEFRSKLLMVFAVPTWPYAAGEVEVQLIMDHLYDEHAGLLNFTIKETLTSFEPHSGLVYGNMLFVQGFGFAQEPIYRCRLESMVNSSQFILSDWVQPFSATMLECIIDFWPYQSQQVNMTLYRNDMYVTPTRETLRYEMIQAWRGTSMQQQLSFSGGNQVTVVGGGFHPSEQPTYQCRWAVAADSRNGKSVLLKTPAAAEAAEKITCTTPFFFSDRGSAIFSLWQAVSADYAGHDSQIDSDGGVWQQIQQAYLPQGSLRIDFGGNPTLSGGTLNGAIRGNTPITLRGSNFGYKDVSPGLQVGDSACEYTQWYAESQLVCSVPAKGAEPLSNDIIMTVGIFHIGSTSRAFSYDGSLLAQVYRTLISRDGESHKYSNSMTKGGTHITMHGMNFDVFDHSIAARIGGSACQTTRWVSGTALTCQSSHGQANMNLLSLSIAHVLSTSTHTRAFSFDFPKMYSLVNPSSPHVGGSESTLTGMNLGTFSLSPHASFGGSACERSAWVSDSHVIARVTRGYLKTRAMVISSGGQQRIATATAFLSYDSAITLSGTQHTNRPFSSVDTLWFGKGLTQVFKHLFGLILYLAR